MQDVILIAVIVAFFAAGAWLVTALDRMITRRSGDEAEGEDEAGAPEREPHPGRPA
jgi:hypothetical protein